MKTKFIACIVSLCVCLFAMEGMAAKTVMRVGWATPISHHYGTFAQKFAELATKYTDGTVEVKLFPNGQLGSEDAAFKSLQMGTVSGYIITMSNVSSHYPLMDVFALPYIFTSFEHMKKVLTSDFTKQFFKTMQAKTGVGALSYGPLDTRDLYNTRKDINNISDFTGLKYRVPKNELMIETFKAFGAAPVPLAWSETPSALQTGTVDGGDNGTGVIMQMKFYEIAKHLTVLDHFLSFSPLFVGEKFMNKLTEQQRQGLYRAAAEANVLSDEITISGLETTRAFLEKNGMTITRPDKTSFIKAAQKVQQDFAQKQGQEFKDLLKKMQSI